MLTGRVNVEFAEVMRRWATSALAEAAGWPDDLTAAPPDRSAMERMASLR